MKAYNDRDLETFLSYMHPEFTSQLFESQDRLCESLEDARRVYRKRFNENKQLFATTLTRIVNDNVVVESQLIEGFDQGETIHAIAIFELQDNLVRRASFVRRTTNGHEKNEMQ